MCFSTFDSTRFVTSPSAETITMTAFRWSIHKPTFIVMVRSLVHVDGYCGAGDYHPGEGTRRPPTRSRPTSHAPKRDRPLAPTCAAGARVRIPAGPATMPVHGHGAPRSGSRGDPIDE